MKAIPYSKTKNSQALAIGSIPLLSPEDFASGADEQRASARRILAFFRFQERLFALFAQDEAASILWFSTSCSKNLGGKEIPESLRFLEKLPLFPFATLSIEARERLAKAHAPALSWASTQIPCTEPLDLYGAVAAMTRTQKHPVSHALAASLVLEALSGVEPKEIHQQRLMLLELERVAAYAEDLSSLFVATAMTLPSSRFAKLHLLARQCLSCLTGNPLGLDSIMPGGVKAPLMLPDYRKNFAKLRKNFAKMGRTDRLAENAFFQEVGRILPATAETTGAVGITARACGLPRDARHTHPVFSEPLPPPLVLAAEGDVGARTKLRLQEIRTSLDLLGTLSPPKSVLQPILAPLAKESLAASAIESPHGEVVHVLGTDDEGGLALWLAWPSSFYNTPALEEALTGESLAHFPAIVSSILG